MQPREDVTRLRYQAAGLSYPPFIFARLFLPLGAASSMQPVVNDQLLEVGAMLVKLTFLGSASSGLWNASLRWPLQSACAFASRARIFAWR